MKGIKKKTKKGSQKTRVFLDYASITPVDSRVGKRVAEVEEKFWANPSSIHSEGESAKNTLEESKRKIASVLHSRSSEVVITSGGTESLNLAILGVVAAFEKDNVGVPHIITSIIEHPAVLEPIKSLVKSGKAEASYVMPNESGLVSAESVEKELRKNTVLVAIQHANNEIGTIQPISKISKLVKSFRDINNSNYPYVLADASQSFLYEHVSLERLQADLIVVDGIKVYGPRGSGVLVVRSGTRISSLYKGGGQENGLRSGTENVAGAAGLALALEMGAKVREEESKRLTKIRDYLIKRILEEFSNSSLNGDQKERLPNNANICFSGSDSEFLVIRLDVAGFAVSAASACHALSLENSSYVIDALGKKGCGSSSLRFTFGRQTKKADIDALIVALHKIIKH